MTGVKREKMVDDLYQFIFDLNPLRRQRNAARKFIERSIIIYRNGVLWFIAAIHQDTVVARNPRRFDEDVIVIDNEVQRWWIHYRRIYLSIMKNQFVFDTATPATNIEVIESEI